MKDIKPTQYVKQTVKAGANVVAATASAIVPIATPAFVALSEVIGIVVDNYGALSEKRSSELFFSDPEYVSDIVGKIKASDDFASFVYDVWVRHNFESYEERRKLLRTFLKNATYDSKNNFANFTHMNNIIQEISLEELRLCNEFYNRKIEKYSKTNNDINLEDFHALCSDCNIKISNDLEESMDHLAYYGLLKAAYGRMGGTFYSCNEFGKIFLEYIKEN